MFIVGFTTPPSNPEKSEVIQDLVAVLVTSMVTKKSEWSSPFLDEILQAVNELVGLGNRCHMKDVGFSTKENLCISEPTIDPTTRSF